MPNIYVQAAIVAAAGLAIAGIDFAMRPPTTAAKQDGTGPSGPKPAPPKPATGPEDGKVKPTPPEPKGGAPDKPNTPAAINPTAGDAAVKVIPNLDVSTLGPEIGVAEAYTLNESAAAVFLDVRKAEDFAAGHIRDARNLPVNDLLDGKPSALAFIGLYTDKSQRFVIYCGGGDCHDSHNAVDALSRLGYTTMHVYKDGFPGWSAAKLPSETGADPGFQ